MASDQNTVPIYHRPDWHPKLQQLLGDITGQYGYTTRFGTIVLLGPLYPNPDIAATTYDTNDDGPTVLFSAA